MPTVLENRDRWQHHTWAQQGDEWSPGRSAEGTAVLWRRTVRPRIHRYVPTGTVLEIGPGFGRWTQYLRHLCRRLILIDLAERCISACRERFAGDAHIEYITNDGASLEMVPDHSVDFIFSFDSLVHAEADAVAAYLAQAARKLKRGGAGFIHHSNLGAFVHPRTGQVRRFVTKRNWRAESMSADVFRRSCDAAGLACRSQELINWIGRGRSADQYKLDGKCIPLTDCLSVFSASGGTDVPPRIVVNPAFVDEWRQAVWMADVYLKDASEAGPSPDESAPAGRAHLFLRKLATARRVRQRQGMKGVAAIVVQQTLAAVRSVHLEAEARVLGEVNRWFAHRHFDVARRDSDVARRL